MKCGTCGAVISYSKSIRRPGYVDADGDALCSRCENLEPEKQEDKKGSYQERGDLR